MTDDVVGLYGLFDRIDGEFNTGFETYGSDESAALAFAKTAAFSNVMPEQFELRKVADVNLKTGEISSLPSYVVPFDDAVYQKCMQMYKAREPKKNEEANPQGDVKA